jgi:DNA-binding helix-hairpin-helix protein with protein kinase domain
MALLVCADCSTVYAVGLSACPHCLSTDREEDHLMPKISIHGGPTNDAEPVVVGEPGPEVTDLPDGTPVQPQPEEEPSPGNSSETSSEKPPTSPKRNASAARSRARTTESPS